MAFISIPYVNLRGAPIASTVLLPGNPTHAKFIVDNFLQRKMIEFALSLAKEMSDE